MKTIVAYKLIVFKRSGAISIKVWQNRSLIIFFQKEITCSDSRMIACGRDLQRFDDAQLFYASYVGDFKLSMEIKEQHSKLFISSHRFKYNDIVSRQPENNRISYFQVQLQTQFPPLGALRIEELFSYRLCSCRRRQPASMEQPSLVSVSQNLLNEEKYLYSHNHCVKSHYFIDHFGRSSWTAKSQISRFIQNS